MTAGRRDLHRRPRRELPDDIGEIVPRVVLGRAHAVHPRGRSRSGQAQPGEQRVGAAQLVRVLVGHGFVREHGDQLPQGPHAQDGHPWHERRLGGGAFRDDDLLVAGVRGGQYGGQDAPDRPHPSVQTQLPDHHDVGEHPGIDPFRSSQYRRGHRQVEAAAALRDRRRAEPHRQFLLRPGAARVDDRGPHPVLALRQALVGQSHQRERGDARFEVGLYLHDHTFDAHQRHRTRTSEPHLRPPPGRARPRPCRAGARRRPPGRYGPLPAGLRRARGSIARRGLVGAPPSRV